MGANCPPRPFCHVSWQAEKLPLSAAFGVFKKSAAFLSDTMSSGKRKKARWLRSWRSGALQ